MSVQLLDKTRKITRLIHNNTSSKVVFNDICRVMTECLDSNIMVLSHRGKILGCSFTPAVPKIDELLNNKVGVFIDHDLNDRVLNILSTQDNVNLATLGFGSVNSEEYSSIISPIMIAGERLGTIFMYRTGKRYDIDDIILSEYGTTVVGLEILRSDNEAIVEEKRRKQIVKSAFSTLSSSELTAAIHIFSELDGDEGILIASKIADEAGITRSVIVNALRKFESAGIIKSHSGGMKGTYIKVVNSYLFDELREITAAQENSSDI